MKLVTSAARAHSNSNSEVTVVKLRWWVYSELDKRFYFAGTQINMSFAGNALIFRKKIVFVCQGVFKKITDD